MIAQALITISDLREIEVGATAPANPVPDMIWVDTSVTPNIERRWDWNETTQTGQWVIVNDVSQNTVVTTLQSDLSVAVGKISSVVSEIWPNGDMTASSRIDQTSDKISLVVSDGSTSGNLSLTPAAMSYIGTNVDLDLNGDFNAKAQTITAAAEKINWVASKDGQSGVISLTPDALSYVGNNVNLQTNNSLNIIVGNIENDISDAANTAQGNAQTYTDGVASTISATQDEMKLQIAAQGDVLAVMKLEGDGLWVQTGGENSPYKTLTDGTGFHVYQQDTRIASFANNGITAHSFTMGRVVCRKTSAGGWAWNLA